MTNKLLEKYIKGDTSPKENEMIGSWLKEDASRIKELTAMRRIYEASLWNDTPQEKPIQLSVHKNKHAIYRHPLLKIAAVIIAILTVVNLFLINENWHTTKEAELQSLYVPAGQRAQITLSDGTRVWLNAMSTLTFPSSFNAKSRDVKLIGEGFFEVTSDEKHPFIVHTSKHNIKVLGTTFNVSAYEHTDFFSTSLIEGKVKITDDDDRIKEVLEPGTQVIQREGSRLIKSDIDNFDYFRWKEGLICFDEISVEKLFATLELYYDIKIEIKNRSILKKTFSGKLRVCDGINHALEVIKAHTSFKYVRDDERNVITIR